MFFEMNVPSNELKCSTQVNVILPNNLKEGDTYKTLWLLHGLNGNHTSWMYGSSIMRYAAQYNLAVIMPSVGRSWYADTAYEANYFSFVTKELPQICRTYFKGMSTKREDNIVAGLSMGGYGALKAALRCPAQYGACIALSASLDITRKGRPYNLNEWRGNFGFGLASALELENSENDLFALTVQNHTQGVPFPELYLWCGTEDSLLPINQTFHDLLTALNVPHCFEYSEGDHSWKWWDLHIQSGLAYLFGKS